ncbi:MAG: metallophosphoesterase [Nitrospirae bacterium]|nr:metallophosphoesterase [Nitrospirota bacterium]
MHLYALLKIRAAFTLHFIPLFILIIVMLIMVFAPVIIRQSEKQGLELFAMAFSYIGYTWMGVLFLFCSVAIAIDAYNILTNLYGYITHSDISHVKLSARYAFLVPLIASITIAFYGYFEAKDIRTERLTIKTAKIPKEAGVIKIAQITDVHIGLIVRGERLKEILKKVKDEKPDMLVSTGDLVDGQINRIEGLSELFRQIEPRYGKFAITGNHEFYAGLNQVLDFTRMSGFKLLRAEGVTVEGLINVVGVDDPAGKPYGLFRDVSEKNLLSKFKNKKFTLFLKHRPSVERESHGLFDLQLSGHVHKGQVFPFSILTKFYYPVHAGGMNLSGGSYLYVSRGTGTWGPPIRFLSPPEITIIEIIPQ